jgi:hypothetical protein
MVVYYDVNIGFHRKYFIMPIKDFWHTIFGGNYE